ncbi:MAG: AAA family ATPase [Blastocatellia bacterium]
MNRISVIGTSGSGKTTFANKLAGILGIPHVELDALHWEADWMEASRDVFRSRVREAVAADRWVVDGNYSKSARDLVWERADTIVWLDFSFTVTLGRVLRRTIYRLVTSEECCNGNRERLGQALSRDSIILWALQTYKRHRVEYPPLLAALQQRGAQIIRLHSPKEADRWLAQMIGAASGHRFEEGRIFDE